MQDTEDINRRELLILGAASAAATALPLTANAEASGTAAPVLAKVTIEINGKQQTLQLDTAPRCSTHCVTPASHRHQKRL
jgi:xanthine dehydrogenase YagT iron-sulfur-binding subunit